MRRGRSRLLVAGLSVVLGGGTTAYAAAPSLESTPIYLSDLQPSMVTNGWGPLEEDTSNGEIGANDGGLIALNQTTYLKGLGAHAPSDLHYALPSNCLRFKAHVGVDDEVGPRGSVVFQVYADAAKVYDSGLLTGKSATQRVDVSILGAAQLRLVVTADGNDDYDHADWADARITCKTAHSRASNSGTNFGLLLLGIAGALCAVGLVLRRRERHSEQR